MTFPSITEHQLWDFAATAAAIVAGLYTGFRRNMMRPDNDLWHTAPPLVRFVLAVQSILFLGVAFSLLRGAHQATPVETLLLGGSAIVSFAMAWNYDHHSRREQPEDAETAATAPSSANGHDRPAEPKEPSERSFAPPRDPSDPPRP